MKTNLFNLKSFFALTAFLLATSSALAIRAPEVPLEKRVEKAERIFVGKVINKEVDGDWVKADLLVEKPLRNAEKDSKIPITYRKNIGNQPIYDITVGSKGVAILTDKHKDRYWLGHARFEKMEKLEEIEKLVKKADE
ncbi:MAG: hypothetical protein AB8D78_08725 [Akkermansiaceae bacterium]